MEVFYQSSTAGTGGLGTLSMADSGIVWHLRYRSAGGTHKWEMVGGNALSCDAEADTGNIAVTLNVFNTLGGAARIVAPLAGNYSYRIECKFYSGTSTEIFTGVKNNATNPAAGTNTSQVLSQSGVTVNTFSGYHAYEGFVTVATAGHELTHVATMAASGNLNRRGARLIVTPIRVS